MDPALNQIAGAAWTLLLVVWIAGALVSKQTVRVENSPTRRLHLVLLVVATVLLFGKSLRIGPLVWRFVPDTLEVAWSGLVLTLAGIAFALLARFYLAGNWSASVAIKQDHRLICSGPYAIVRHPIYTGALVAMVGRALMIGQLRGIAGVLLTFASWYAKSRMEERFMREQFGDEYVRYSERVKALIPFIL